MNSVDALIVHKHVAIQVVCYQYIYNTLCGILNADIFV